MAANVLDVAKYILQQHGSMSTMKLQKLVFYCQAYRLAWTGSPLFPQAVRAWTNGPVVYELFRKHKGKFEVGVDEISGDPDELDATDRIVVDAILSSLGNLTGWELRNRTHEEAPWDDAFDPGEAWHNTEITHEAMKSYYAKA